MSKIPERFIWAAQVMDVKPSDTILEIGCGTGILAGEIAKARATGKLIAIDRSAAMIAKAKKKYGEHTKKDVLEFQVSEFAQIEKSPARYDIIVAFNVNFFLKKELLN